MVMHVNLGTTKLGVIIFATKQIGMVVQKIVHVVVTGNKTKRVCG